VLTAISYLVVFIAHVNLGVLSWLHYGFSVWLWAKKKQTTHS